MNLKMKWDSRHIDIVEYKVYIKGSLIPKMSKICPMSLSDVGGPPYTHPIYRPSVNMEMDIYSVHDK
jgi:hypothetical protein